MILIEVGNPPSRHHDAPRPGSPADGDHHRSMRPHADRQRPAAAPRVLLVDDSAAMRTVLRGVLEDAGMVVVGEAVDGLDGIAQAEGLDPEVVLMDWRMPSLDGIGATTRIRQRLPHVQVVMFSHAESEGAELARQAGAVAFVPKGAAVESICDAVLAAWHRSDPPGPHRAVMWPGCDLP